LFQKTERAEKTGVTDFLMGCGSFGAAVSEQKEREREVLPLSGALTVLCEKRFIDRVMADPRLNSNPLVDEAHHRVPPAGFKCLVTEMVCWATGGPQKYTGKSMGDSHAHLKITAEEWEAFLDDFQQTLDKFAVPAVEQGELKAIVNSTRADIVVASAPRAEVA
jgi:hemoglobin